MADNYQIELTLEEIFGTGISSIEQTTVSTMPGGENIWTVTLTNGNAYNFTVLNGTAGGDPIPVLTASEMTDTSAVYLYLGTETGYYFGHWYYNDGSWKEGGSYGTKGDKGADGFSPIVEITKDGDTTTLKITDAEGEHISYINDGVRPVVNAASVASDMTDTDIIYVYVGATTDSLTNGDWYFYNGAEWASGGAYNSAALITDKTLTQADMAADAKEVGDEIASVRSAIGEIEEEIESGTGRGLTADIKEALLQLAQKVAYIDEDGQDYYDDLHDALYPPVPATAISLSDSTISWYSGGQTKQLTATLTPSDSTDSVAWGSSNPSVATVSNSGLVTGVSYGTTTIIATAGSVSAACSVVIAPASVTGISAVYTQSGTVYTTDSLDSLKDDLVVTATWSDGNTSIVPSADYTLSGTLTEGSSTITVSYGGESATFTVTVTSTLLYSLENHVCDGTASTIVNSNVLLCDTDKDFTVLVDLVTTAKQPTSWRIMGNLSSASGTDAGFYVGKSNNTYLAAKWCTNMATLTSLFTNTSTGHVRIAVTHSSGSDNMKAYVKYGSNAIVSKTYSDTFGASSYPLYIGGNASGSHTLKGTISCDIYGVALAQADIESWLSEVV